MIRHCEKRSDEAIHLPPLDCFAWLVLGQAKPDPGTRNDEDLTLERAP